MLFISPILVSIALMDRHNEKWSQTFHPVRRTCWAQQMTHLAVLLLVLYCSIRLVFLALRAVCCWWRSERTCSVHTQAFPLPISSCWQQKIESADCHPATPAIDPGAYNTSSMICIIMCTAYGDSLTRGHTFFSPLIQINSFWLQIPDVSVGLVQMISVFCVLNCL